MAARTTSNDFAAYARRAFEPAARLNEVVLGNVERVARFQYEGTGEVLQFGLDQLNATTQARDLPALVARQRALATEFAAKAQTRQQAFAALATESQAGFARWLEETAATFGKPA